MAKQTIDIGSSPNKGDGDPLRTAFTKINQNFDELYAGGFADPDSVGSNLSPDTDATYNLGAADKQWADVHISDFLYLNGQRIEALPNGALLVNGSGARESADIVGSVFGDDSTTLVDAVNNVINLDGTISGDVVPDANEAYDLGSSTHRFRDLYLSGSTLNLGGTTLSVVGGELQLGGVKVPTTADVAATVASAVSAPTGDLTGSVFANDSTLLVDGVAGKIVGDVEKSGILTLRTTDNDMRLYAAGDFYFEAGEGANDFTVNAGLIELGGDVELDGTLTFPDATVQSTAWTGNAPGLTYTDPGGGLSTQVGLDADIFDFGTGNTVDLQGNSVLFDGATVQNFAPGNVYALDGQYLYFTSKHSGGSTTNAAFIYDTNISNVRQTFYGKTEFANNGQAPIVDFTGATISGVDWASIVGNAIQNNGLPVLPTQTLDISGSVFADDSTLLVDGVNGKLIGDVVTTSITNSRDIDIASEDDVAIITSAGNNNYEWFFNSGGYLSFPPNGELFFDGDAGIVFSTAYDIAGSTAHIDIRDTGSTANLSIDNDAANGTIDITANGYVTIATDDDGTRYEFNFGADGSLTLPGAVVSTPDSSTGGADSSTATALDVTKTLQVLNSADGNDDWWSLADGTEGQIMYFVPGTGAGPTQHKVTIANWRRWDSGAGVSGEWVVETNLDWLPFKLDFDGTRWTGVATAIFTDGAWQTNNPWID